MQPVVRGLALVPVVALAGCFDWDQLLTPRDGDLGVNPPDAALTDGGMPPDLALVIPHMDLGACPPPPTIITAVVKVGGNGGGPKTIADGVKMAQSLGSHSAVFVAEGTYPETLGITGFVTIYGGFNADFSCHDPAAHPTLVSGSVDDVATILLDGGASIEGLHVTGRGTTPIGVTASGGSGPITDCLIQSQPDLKTAVVTAHALQAVASENLQISTTTILAGAATQANDATASVAVTLCSASASLGFVQMFAQNDGGGGATGLLVTDGCGPPAAGTIVVQSSIIVGAAAGPANGLHVNTTDSALTLAFAGTAIASGGSDNAQAILSDGKQAQTITLDESTVSCSGRPSSTAVLLQNLRLVLYVKNSIVAGSRTLVASTQEPVLNADGLNLWYSGTLGAIGDGGMAPILLTVGNVSYDFGWIGQRDKNGQFTDPGLDPNDGIHLKPGSPAIDKFPKPCDVPYDIDGQSRPQGNGCDIGADEF